MSIIKLKQRSVVDGPVVILTSIEQHLVEWVAEKRQSENDAARVRDAKVGTRSSIEYHRIGFAGELAFCRLFNLYPDLSTTPRRGSSDCVVNGATVDVKTTDLVGGRLMVKASKRGLMIPDWFVLMVMQWPKFRYVGSIRGSAFLTPQNLLDVGYGPTYTMDQSTLAKQTPHL